MLPTNIKQRTSQQNKALWLMFTHLAEELNKAGLDMKKTLKPEIDIPWNKDTIHDFLWIPIQKAQLGTESTTELTTKDIDKIMDTLTRHLGQKLGIEIMFPSIETLMLERSIKQMN